MKGTRDVALAQSVRERAPRRGRLDHVQREMRRARAPLFFILPAIIFAAIFLYYPALSGLYHAFFDWDGVSQADFIGLSNFQEMMSDPSVRTAFTNVGKLTGVGVVIVLTVPLMAARLINGIPNLRVQYIFRVGFVIPLVVPNVVLLLVWGFFYDPTDGMLNRLLTDMHQSGLTQAWLGDPAIALYGVMVSSSPSPLPGFSVGFPWVDAFALLIYTAGLQSIPGEILEAAAMDGAGARQRFLRIELPLILGQVRLLVVLVIINGLQNFTQILILTQGGPGEATTVPGLYLYQQAFISQRMGYASSIALVLFAIIVVLTAINVKFIRPATEFEGAAA
jgi:raffinose/stachyose/melibiose transport system permease protein